MKTKFTAEVEHDINLTDFGADFTNLFADEQARFFHGMACELRNWESVAKNQMQFLAVAKILSQEDKKTLENTLSCLWYEGDEG